MEGWTCSHGDAIQAILNAELLTNKVGNPGMRNRPRYIDIVTAFDIEATRLPDIEQAFMYVWQWQIGPDCLIMGRTWEEFLEVLHTIRGFIQTGFGYNARLVVWVHALSYEFQFLRGIYPFQRKEVLCMASRKVVKSEMFKCFEFRCSYIHSNMSLDLFGKKMGCQILKLTGTFDYDKIRYPWTKLTESELAYCKHDVAVLVEAITREMRLDGDTLATIPMTSTGYVRRDAKAALQSRKGFRPWLKAQLPDYKLYLALREAFRGGNTHANRFMARKILEDVHSVDRSSSYPDVLVNCEYPVTEFKHRGPCSMDRLIRQIEVHHYAMVIRIALFNVRLRDEWTGCPYLSKDKCRLIHNGVYDNGRILSAEYLETTLTDIDFRIVRKQYMADNPCVFDSWEAHYGYLPDEFRNLVNEYYRKKTELKGDEEQRPFYDKIKAKINALFGLSAQNPVKEDIVFASWEDVERWYMKHTMFYMPAEGPNYIPNDDLTPEQQLAKYNRKAFMVYQWGVWVTAHARRELQEMIDLAGDNFVYTDTDSVKYIGELDLTEYNTRIRARSESNGAHADDAKGHRHWMGVYEQEADYARFVTLGAKKYAYEQWDYYPIADSGVTLQLLHTHVTCAGVNKTLGGKELAHKGGLEAFKPGFCFKEAGGTKAVYNDNVNFEIQREGHTLRITDNVVIQPSEYTLGLTNEYTLLLHRAELMYQLHREMQMNRDLTI